MDSGVFPYGLGIYDIELQRSIFIPFLNLGDVFLLEIRCQWLKYLLKLLRIPSTINRCGVMDFAS